MSIVITVLKNPLFSFRRSNWFSTPSNSVEDRYFTSSPISLVTALCDLCFFLRNVKNRNDSPERANLIPSKIQETWKGPAKQTDQSGLSYLRTARIHIFIDLRNVQTTQTSSTTYPACYTIKTANSTMVEASDQLSKWPVSQYCSIVSIPSSVVWYPFCKHIDSWPWYHQGPA